MTMCCPLSGCDDQPTVYSTTHPMARREHRCEECREAIPIGARYEFYKSLFDGSWSTTKTCLSCAQIRTHFSCGNGYIIGMLWEELENNFFPDMKAGGPCMDGLSPENKARLFERRLAWVMSHDEYPPCDAALPPRFTNTQTTKEQP